jgi:hypothetical protein
LGADIENNVIQDSLGGIIIGVQHGVNYWEGKVTSASETGRVFFTALVTGNTFEFDSSFLSSWATTYVADGNDPADDFTPPTVTIGSGYSAEAPGPYGSPRFPWTVGNAITVNGNDAPIFVDPIENVVTVQGNSALTMSSSGALATHSGPSGQVYAGIVNGATVSTAISPETFNNQPYYPLNLDNLDISAGKAAAPPPSPSPSPSPPNPPIPPVNPPPPVAPSAPLNPRVSLTGLNQIDVSWDSAAGASSYIVERSLDGAAWSVIAAAVAATSYLDTGLNYATLYYYRVLAVSSAGNSPASAMVSAQTEALPDALSGVSLVMDLTRGSSFTGPLARFTDANTTTSAVRLFATIVWGDGTISLGTIRGGDGTFTVSGTHAYTTVGVFAVEVSLSMTGPDAVSASVTGAVDVTAPRRHRPRSRPRHIPRSVKKLKRPAIRGHR